jgi:hypothetical protein
VTIDLPTVTLAATTTTTRPADLSPAPFIVIGLIASAIGATLLFDLGGAATALIRNTQTGSPRAQTPAFGVFFRVLTRVMGTVALLLGAVSTVAGLAMAFK